MGKATKTRKQLLEELEMSNGCLNMVQDALAKCIPMAGCPAMLYDDAIHNLAQFYYWLGSRGVRPKKLVQGESKQWNLFLVVRVKAINKTRREGRKPTVQDLCPRRST
jgi:hypothetical protein